MIPFIFSRVDKAGADFEKIMEEVFRLRFKVYCEEWGFEDPTNYPDGLEHNEYDDVSDHFIIRSTNDASIVGTARIIFPGKLGYPVAKHCSIDPELQEHVFGGIKDAKIGEVSRLAISKDYRRRIEDDAVAGYAPSLPDEERLVNEQRKCNYVHEFYKFLLLQSIELGLTHWYVAMKRGLYVLLKRVGMVYHPIGPEVDYHGLRTPYLGNLQEIRRGMMKKDAHCFNFIESQML
ncbi:MAG: PEP-CTERM/exosortase system-associated acyltransferase [Desulfuromonadales bacterium]|nr:MAG: PEP-CTERM/exosortase system-associated acyltransferase [Desulfuromonadales bacterium]